MLCYIKDFKTFETLSKFDSTEYSLAEGENGGVTIYQKNAVELTKKYVGMWLIINKELFYISGATPNDDSIDLVIQSPIYAFYRQVVYDGSETYGTLIKNILDDNYGINCPDNEYKLTYLTVTATDSTPCIIEPDDYGYVIPFEVFDDALYYGVAIDFNFTNTSLSIIVRTANYDIGTIVFNDGSTTLESESYDINYVAKVTVIHDLGAPESEEENDESVQESEESIEEEDDEPAHYYEEINYYLSTDGYVTTTPPQNRAKGLWKYYTANQDESPLAVAIGAFSHNNDNHKIEFRSLKRFALYQSINMRLRGELFSTIITARILSSNDNRYYYKCGNLATTLTEKIESNNDSSSNEVKSIKKKISIIQNKIDEGLPFDEVYPIGSIYMSVNSTDPSNLFGGTWERITGKFLLAATDNGNSGANQAAGNTGGEAEHTLTVRELPSHSHDLKGGDGSVSDWFGGSSADYGIISTGTTYSNLIGVTGENAAHNNMPPYLAVYMWKRTA